MEYKQSPKHVPGKERQNPYTALIGTMLADENAQSEFGGPQ